MPVPDTLKSAAQKYWKDFLPAWVVPLVMMGDTIREDIQGTQASPLFINFVFALFFLSFLWWVRLPMTNRLKQSHATVLGMLLPFVIWTALVLIHGLFFFVSGVEPAVRDCAQRPNPAVEGSCAKSRAKSRAAPSLLR